MNLWTPSAPYVAVLSLCLFFTPLYAETPPSIHTEHNDISFALLEYGGGHWNPRPNGLPRLAWEIRRRTSIDIHPNPVSVTLLNPSLFAYPFLVWQGDTSFTAFSEAERVALRQYLHAGGTLWVDVSDAQPQSLFERSVLRELQQVFPREPLQRIPQKHVLYKSFYLLRNHGGRVLNKAYLEGILIEGRWAVIITGNDIAGAIARNSFGEYDFDVGEGGDAAREMSVRIGVNIMMYALCLDYKDDQVHIPFILQRRH
jgi:hypothetical protein